MNSNGDKTNQVFKFLDKKNENMIDKVDVPQGMRYLGIIKTKIGFSFILDQLPDKLNRTQFIDLIQKEKEHSIGKKEMMEAFEVFDEKKTGKLFAKDLYHALSVIGEKLTEDDIEYLKGMVKEDGEGKISYSNLADCLLAK